MDSSKGHIYMNRKVKDDILISMYSIEIFDYNYNCPAIRCKFCNIYTYGNARWEEMKSHLIDHKKGTDSTTSMEFRYKFLWRYMSTQDKNHDLICKYCNQVMSYKNIKYLENHLFMHRRIIIDIRNEINQSWIGKHFISDNSIRFTMTKCTICDHPLSVSLGIHGLQHHLYYFHNMCKNITANTSTEKNNLDLMLQQYLPEGLTNDDLNMDYIMDSETIPTAEDLCNMII